MFIYNSTFHCDITCHIEFVNWIRQEYIPRALTHKGLTEPRLARIFGEDDLSGRNISIQFKTPDLETLSDWYNKCGVDILRDLEKKFGNKVAGFSTIMEELDIE